MQVGCHCPYGSLVRSGCRCSYGSHCWIGHLSSSGSLFLCGYLLPFGSLPVFGHLIVCGSLIPYWCHRGAGSLRTVVCICYIGSLSDVGCLLHSGSLSMKWISHFPWLASLARGSLLLWLARRVLDVLSAIGSLRRDLFASVVMARTSYMCAFQFFGSLYDHGCQRIRARYSIMGITAIMARMESLCVFPTSARTFTLGVLRFFGSHFRIGYLVLYGFSSGSGSIVSGQPNSNASFTVLWPRCSVTYSGRVGRP